MQIRHFMSPISSVQFSCSVTCFSRLGFPDSSVGKESACNTETLIQFLGQEDPLEKDRLPTPVFLGFPCGSASKESACNAGDQGSIPGLGRSPGEGKGYPFQYSGLENSMDCTVHGVTKSRTRLSDFHFRPALFSPRLCLVNGTAGGNKEEAEEATARASQRSSDS